MGNLRFAVLGTGFWSHFQIPAWFEVGGVDLVACYNRTVSKAEAVARKFDIPRVYGDPEVARSYLLPLLRHLADHGLGSISEIFDAEPPFIPHGCFAQAWSVAEVLRAWHACDETVRQETKL